MGALTSHGSTKLGGSSMITGADSSIAGWNCPPGGVAKPGIAIDDSTKISTAGCSNLNCIAGSPKIQQTAAAADTNTYFRFGDLTWKELTAMADPAHSYATGVDVKNIAPVDSAGVKCVKTAASTWGDVRRGSTTPYPCEGFFPIIYARGNLSLSAQSKGQGILLVEGDLAVSGGFEFYGPVIVRGSLKTTGSGGHFNGGVMAANVDLEQSTVLGDAVISYSSCAILKALAGSSLPMPVRDRAWVDLF